MSGDIGMTMRMEAGGCFITFVLEGFLDGAEAAGFLGGPPRLLLRDSWPAVASVGTSGRGFDDRSDFCGAVPSEGGPPGRERFLSLSEFLASCPDAQEFRVAKAVVWRSGTPLPTVVAELDFRCTHGPVARAA